MKVFPLNKRWVTRGALAFLATGLFAVSPVRAQITIEPASPLPVPKKFASGMYVDVGMGSQMFLGEAREALGIGVAFHMGLGYDLWQRYISVQGRVGASDHRTHFGLSPQSGQVIQFYQSGVELKFALPLGQWAIHLNGGGGMGYFSTNLLETVGLMPADKQFTWLFGGGGGVEYHTRSRHFSFGLQGRFDKVVVMQIPGAVAGSTYLRYTF